MGRLVLKARRDPSWFQPSRVKAYISHLLDLGLVVVVLIASLVFIKGLLLLKVELSYGNS
jgi:hypothetical protein